MRGIAAFSVVICHCIGTLPVAPRWSFHFPLSLFDAGDGAVYVFFALSGCVLFLSLQGRAPVPYFAYLTKRFFRIYPTFGAAVLGSAALFALVHPHAVPGVSDWFNRHWQVPPTLQMLLGHFAMTDVASLQQLDNPMWSLVHEIRISLIFPLVALWVAANWRAAVLVTIIVSAVCTSIESHAAIGWMFDPVRTLSYLYLFAAGAVAASHADAVRGFLRRSPFWLQLTLWVAALRLVTVPVEHYLGVVTGAGALLIIVLAFGTATIDRVLSTTLVLTWLGRVSYSLYLVHFPIIMACVHLLHGRLPLTLIFGVAIVLSLAMAELMNRFVERPSIALGRRIASLPALRRTFSPRETPTRLRPSRIEPRTPPPVFGPKR